MIIRKLEVNGKTVVLTEDVIRELHRQEHIEEGKLMIERFASKDVYNKMTDDAFSRRRITVRHLCGTLPYNRDWMHG